MDEPQYLLGKPVSFKEAFPDVQSLELEVTQDRAGYYCQSWQRTERFNIGHVPGTIRCRNPQCKRGGCDIKDFIYFAVQQRKTEDSWSTWCGGDEGSPKGRRPGKPCDNNFDVSLKLTYKDPNAL